MKNLFKKLSFVLALAMVLTSVAPATASAATVDKFYKSGDKTKTALKAATVFFGDAELDLQAVVGGKSVTNSVTDQGYWKVGNTKVATIDKKTGVVTPVANGKTTVAFVKNDGTKITLPLTVATRGKLVVKNEGVALASGAEVEAKVGDKVEFVVGRVLTATAKNAGATKVSPEFTAVLADVEGDAVVATQEGKIVTVECKEAGEATLTFVAGFDGVAYSTSKNFTKKVVVKVAATELNVKATGASELTATLSEAVAEGTAVSVKRGTTTVNASVKFDGNKVVITTDAKMIAGTYTVKVGDLEGTCEVEDQKVAEIVINADGSAVAAVSTSNASPAGALDGIVVSYDVLDQYGNSLRTASTLQWSGSLVKRAEDIQKGYVVFGTSDGKALTYGSTVYLTAVYSKNTNVVTKSTELTVGLEAKTDEIVFAGITEDIVDVKIKDTLSTNFVLSGEAYLLFTAKDQYGTPVDMTYFDFDDVTFAVTTPLLLNVDKTTTGTVVVDQVTYGYVKLVPALNATKGGAAKINAISAKTGKQVLCSVDIVSDQVLTKFALSVPSDIVSEGRTVEIAFTALDQNNEAITSYRVLNGAVSFSTSSGELTMVEQNDGSAKLFYTAPTTGASDDLDLYVTITSVVTNSGSVDSQAFYVKEKARPAAILSVGGDKVLLENGSVQVYDNYHWSGSNITYVDQYGRAFVRDYGVQDAEITAWLAIAGNGVVIDDSNVTKIAVTTGSGFNTILGVTTAGVNAAYSETVTYSLVSTINGVANTLVPGSSKKVTYKVVDISSLVSFEAAGLGLAYAQAPTANYHKTVSVTGKMADGTVVKVPYTYDGTTKYFSVTLTDTTWDGTTKYSVANASDSADDVIITSGSAIDADAFKLKDAVTGNYYGKRDEKLGVNIAINDVNSDTTKDSFSLTLDVANDAPSINALVAGYGVSDGKAVINATNGDISFAAFISGAYIGGDLKDKYGVTVGSSAANVSVTVSKIVEKNTKDSTIAVNANANKATNLSNVEIGDKFVVTYTSDNGKTLTIEFTVGADTTAKFGTADGAYSTMY